LRISQPSKKYDIARKKTWIEAKGTEETIKILSLISIKEITSEINRTLQLSGIKKGNITNRH
jgi:hypothetical protein